MQQTPHKYVFSNQLKLHSARVKNIEKFNKNSS